MSLARALTVIRSRKSSDPVQAGPTRSLTFKRSFAGTIRNKISAPMELISTTNMISYNAPNICPQNIASSISDSGDSDISQTDFASPFTSPDASSTELSSPPCLKPNHLSCYFGSPIPVDEAPSIPQRAPSHTKSNGSVETFLARKQSKYFNRETRSMARSSIIMFSPEIDTIDPIYMSQEPIISPELERCRRIAHPAIIVDPEEQEIISKGLLRFRAEEYISEVDQIHRLIFNGDCSLVREMQI